MPCQGPSEAELRVMEMYDCEKLYGVRDTELNIATRVACHLAKGESNDLTKRWIKEHDRRDEQRKLREAADKKHKAFEKDLKAAEKSLRKKHKL